MQRMSLVYLQSWMNLADRKPLIIRGARQVGKTWLVRQLVKQSGKELIELNLEKQPSYLSLFDSNDLEQVLLNLSALHNKKIDPKHSLLFLDEIQTAPQLLAKLRWFAEDCPELPVIAAGSLLDFVLAEASFSMPVGRISYMHLEPMSFEEFLIASDKKFLCGYLMSYQLKTEMPLALHEELSNLFKEYLLIGGMPAVVLNWINERSLTKANQIQHDLLATYRDDFAKYKGRMALQHLDEVMMAVPRMLGQKFVFSKIGSVANTNSIKQILDLFSKARICNRVWSCSANGVPLASEIKEKYFKEIFLDVGLCSAALGLNLNQLSTPDDVFVINKGGLAEQVTGQLLRTINPPYIEPALYCWHREEKNANAEIDYVIQQGNQVIPIEVKAGSTGSLKSLHVFMGLKKLTKALRINADLPSKTDVQVKTHLENTVKYKLISIPFYLIEQIPRLLVEE